MGGLPFLFYGTKLFRKFAARFMQHIYCISGLGADFRIFSKLQVKGATLHPIEWQMPSSDDTLVSFAQKLSSQINHPSPVLLGVSFGGMLATEMARVLPIQKAIIVSSCKLRAELPAYMRAAGRVGLHKAIPFWMVTQSKHLNRFIFDTRSREEELYLKRMMLADTNVEFIRRSVNMILNWRNTEQSASVIHIHGDRDKLLLPGTVQPDYWIKNGGHFMIWNMADKISEILNREIHINEGTSPAL
jgi:pimeloyl-ACP methyl ester carboxylesterase